MNGGYYRELADRYGFGNKDELLKDIMIRIDLMCETFYTKGTFEIDYYPFENNVRRIAVSGRKYTDKRFSLFYVGEIS